MKSPACASLLARRAYEGLGEPFGSVPPGVRVGVPIRASTVADSATSESGLLFMFRRNADKESQTVRVR